MRDRISSVLQARRHEVDAQRQIREAFQVQVSPSEREEALARANANALRFDLDTDESSFEPNELDRQSQTRVRNPSSGT